jgi:hypothetical protein
MLGGHGKVFSRDRRVGAAFDWAGLVVQVGSGGEDLIFVSCIRYGYRSFPPV